MGFELKYLSEILADGGSLARQAFAKDPEEAVAQLAGLPFRENGHLDIEQIKESGSWSSGELVIIVFAVTLYNGSIGDELARKWLHGGLLTAAICTLDDREWKAMLELLRLRRGV